MATLSRKAAWRHLLLSSPVFILLIGSVGLVWQRPWPLFGLLSAACLICLWRWWSARSLGFFLVALILGPCAEYFVVLRGAWTYTGHEVLAAVGLGLGRSFSGAHQRRARESFSVGDFFQNE